MSLKLGHILIIVSILTLWFASCENQNEEDLFGQMGCDTNQVSYSDYVKPLLEDHCYRCHSAPNLIAPFSLEGYANVQIRVSSGQLYGALNHIQGYQPMPRGEPKLPECDLAKIYSWIRDGAPNN
jgi:hypothetical protein